MIVDNYLKVIMGRYNECFFFSDFDDESFERAKGGAVYLHHQVKGSILCVYRRSDWPKLRGFVQVGEVRSSNRAMV